MVMESDLKVVKHVNTIIRLFIVDKMYIMKELLPTKKKTKPPIN